MGGGIQRPGRDCSRYSFRVDAPRRICYAEECPLSLPESTYRTEQTTRPECYGSFALLMIEIKAIFSIWAISPPVMKAVRISRKRA